MIDRYIYVYYVGVPEGNRSLDKLCMIQLLVQGQESGEKDLYFAREIKI
jgi:hypothetical protein